MIINIDNGLRWGLEQYAMVGVLVISIGQGLFIETGSTFLQIFSNQSPFTQRDRFIRLKLSL